MAKVINTQFHELITVDMSGWLMVNMFIGTQMIMASDTEGSFVIEEFNFLPEA